MWLITSGSYYLLEISRSNHEFKTVGSYTFSALNDITEKAGIETSKNVNESFRNMS